MTGWNSVGGAATPRPQQLPGPNNATVTGIRLWVRFTFDWGLGWKK